MIGEEQPPGCRPPFFSVFRSPQACYVGGEETHRFTRHSCCSVSPDFLPNFKLKFLES